MTAHLITTPVAAGIHLRCGTPVIVGVAEGLLARVDLTPLNRAGEIHALIAGLQTYTLTRHGLIHRDAGRIAGTSLAKAGPVLAQHTCRRQIPAEHRANTPPPARVATTGNCPF
ncbi:hypothetical protein GCM10027280_45580 [Micromonospora polyrhachis]|uniref:Uncharacterized protein n=1 Tax=Micromonospora polyrhachis TaxID=1282883 RepID=A0A7W7SQ73_9ACTN|nr:hypothetical protein [Micromonospora polyrhachis]MBB4958929.1 hypothetical protein [Micromonospora polyrhachis]